MSNFAGGLVSFLVLLLLLALRVPIGVAMLAVGAGGFIWIQGLGPLLSFLKTTPFETFAGYSFSVIPLFLLMGNVASGSGLSARLFRGANALLGHHRGGMAMAAVGACAAFGTICGSSLATAATMGQVALPEMRKYGYSGALATGTLAAGGTLDLLFVRLDMLMPAFAALQQVGDAQADDDGDRCIEQADGDQFGALLRGDTRP